jgi:hypothetical protein
VEAAIAVVEQRSSNAKKVDALGCHRDCPSSMYSEKSTVGKKVLEGSGCYLEVNSIEHSIMMLCLKIDRTGRRS